MSSGSNDVVGRIMSKTVRTVAGRTSLRSVLALMRRHDIGSVVVMESGAPVGIITERDVVKKLAARGPRVLGLTSRELASKPVVTTSPETEVWEAFTVMLRKKIRRLPVMKGNRLVGIVTERDLLKWVVGVLYEPNVPRDVKKLIAQNS